MDSRPGARASLRWWLVAIMGGLGVLPRVIAQTSIETALVPSPTLTGSLTPTNAQPMVVTQTSSGGLTMMTVTVQCWYSQTIAGQPASLPVAPTDAAAVGAQCEVIVPVNGGGTSFYPITFSSQNSLPPLESKSVFGASIIAGSPSATFITPTAAGSSSFASNGSSSSSKTIAAVVGSILGVLLLASIATSFILLRRRRRNGSSVSSSSRVRRWTTSRYSGDQKFDPDNDFRHDNPNHIPLSPPPAYAQQV